jgi:hypothetical protein
LLFSTASRAEILSSPLKAFCSEVETGSREENAFRQKTRGALPPIQAGSSPAALSMQVMN